MTRLGTKLGTLVRLGLPNVWRVICYRVGIRTGLGPACRVAARLPKGPFFSAVRERRSVPEPTLAWRDEARCFGRFAAPLAGGFPDWSVNPLTGGRFARADLPWWQLADFDPGVGDIKGIWEASRFDWVLAMAERVCSGQEKELDRLNAWLANWCDRNPAFTGPNWKCGQEASIRVMHLAMGALLLGQQRSTAPGLKSLVRAHLARIFPSMQYARAQDNNHGTSEAAALFIGGTWLAGDLAEDQEQEQEQARIWAKSGRKCLEERVSRLVAHDGSFSQHSVVYHRLLLDTLGMAEVWRRACGLEPFSARLIERARLASLWLRAFTQVQGGDAPNIGANDGARLLPLGDTDYRDFRPSAQLGCALFANARAFAAHGSWDWPLEWLGVPIPAGTLPEDTDLLFDEGGYAVLRQGRATAYLRYPRFRFRPGHADALHLDLWLDGRNILRDAGSFSYNAGRPWETYFPGTSAHNTVEFDGRDQMPRLGRFLFGDWLRTSERSWIVVDSESSSFSAGYRDSEGASHTRTVTLSATGVVVQDKIAGFQSRATLRWRMEPGEWSRNGASVSTGKLSLSVTSDVALERSELVEGWESRYYLRRDPVPVFEVETRTACILRTELRWHR